MSTAAWTAPTSSASGNTDPSRLNTILPITPPTAELTAMGAIARASISDCPLAAFCASVESDMMSTDMLERKLTVLTLMTFIASTTGLMITPPPMPQSGPRSDARKHTAKTKMY